MTITAERPEGSSPEGQPSAEPKKRASKLNKIIPLLLVIAGVAVLLYPVVVTYLRNTAQTAIADSYRNSQSTLTDSDRDWWLNSAHQYNEERAGAPILDPWLNRVSKNNAPYIDYQQQLNPSGEEDAVMAVLSIPGIDVQLPIYHGTEAETLHKGVGHLYGSSLPVGGVDTHAVLTGHTGLTTSTLFDNLDEVVEGDAFYVDALGEVIKYEVDQITIVEPDEVGNIQPIAGGDYITLITCTPYGVNSHRLLVRGARVDMDPAETSEAFKAAGLWQPWMIGVVIVVLIVALIIAFLVWRNARKKSGGKHRVS
ncbi:Sortase A, LPXTG specific [Corynebacterium glutamicum]|uniref:class C sortase n=1 Tax=Corynebacterium glutamicum TaxID=1718 RepID=UPI00097F2151|nr:class C sortase [Corynebacterium glutamicum]SJM57577.1 Sortase A, LPXTG specific [Corynebacterium glutamicum]